MTAADWLNARGGWTDTARGRKAYAAHLVKIGRDEASWEREGLVGLSEGWALGSAAWRKAMATEHAQMVLDPSLPLSEVAELREAAWNASLARVLKAMRRKPKDLETRPLRQDWKVTAARKIREESGAPSRGWPRR
jgi:hypothetical protein